VYAISGCEALEEAVSRLASYIVGLAHCFCAHRKVEIPMSIALQPAVEQLKLLRNKKISPVELAEEHIRRVERFNPALNAIVDFNPDKVRAQAQETKTGELAGLPITIKSSISAAGYRCEVGSVLRRGDVAERDAVAVARLRAEGAVILGTTNCPEFLMAYDGWFERWRGSGDRGGYVCGWSRQRQRRFGARARSLFGHLCPQANVGANLVDRTPPGVHWTVLDARSDWADGAFDCRCRAVVSGRVAAVLDRSGGNAGSVSEDDDARGETTSHRLPGGRRVDARYCGDATGGARRSECFEAAGIRGEGVPASFSGGGARTLGDLFCAVRGDVL
jgi:hypothetical protein